MKPYKLLTSLCVLLVLSIILFELLYRPGRVLASGEPDYQAIDAKIKQYAEIRGRHFNPNDINSLSDVFANDKRGMKTDEKAVKAVRKLKNDNQYPEDEIGYLDQMQALFKYKQEIRKAYDTAIASGLVPTPTYDLTPSNNPVPLQDKGTKFDRFAFPPSIDPESIPAVRELMDEWGYDIAYIGDSNLKDKPYSYTLLSVRVDGDIAYAKVAWQIYTAEEILVKKDGKWFIIGETNKMGG